MSSLEERPRPAVERTALPALEQFFAYRRFQPALAFSRDGGHVYFVCDVSGQFNLWRLPLAGGWPHQLTTFEDRSVRAIAPSRDGESIVLAADRDGDEFHQLLALPAGGGWPEAWTDAPQVQHFVHERCFAPDGRALAFAANARTPADQDVWLRDAESGEVRRLFGDDQYLWVSSWSPDGRRLLVLDWRYSTDTSLSLVDAESGEATELTPHEGEARFFAGPWAADGSGFFLLTDEGREYVGLAFFRLADRCYEWLETPEADVELLAGSADGRRLAWMVNEGGWSRLRIRDLESGEDLPEPQLPPGTCPDYAGALTLSADGAHAAVLWFQPRRPTELYVVETATGEATRLTDGMLGGLSEEELVAPEEIAYPSFDGRKIPGWLYRPRASGRVPVVLSVHGGPEWQERPWYQPLYQYLLSRGIAVLATNIRGSTGYGKSYQKLIHHDWGGGDLEDWRHAAEWLRAQDWADGDRLGVYGGSYGGFATLTCLTRLPEYWAAGVDIVGPSNLVTLVKTGPPQWVRFDKVVVGDPDTEQDFLLERSPISHVENVRAPLLVLQGATDPRVPKSESDQMVERLRELGRDVEYVVFDDEGHGFTRRTNQLRASRLAAEFLERHLLGAR